MIYNLIIFVFSLFAFYFYHTKDKKYTTIYKNMIILAIICFILNMILPPKLPFIVFICGTILLQIYHETL